MRIEIHLSNYLLKIVPTEIWLTTLDKLRHTTGEKLMSQSGHVNSGVAGIVPVAAKRLRSAGASP